MFSCCTSGAIDSINLNDIDSEAIALKHDRNIRKHPDYQLLRKLAREGCNVNDRRLIWIKATNAQEKDITIYNELSKTLFEDIDMYAFPQFPMFGSKCRFKTLSFEEKYSARKILVILAVEHDSLHYCPQIPFVVEVIVQHVEEAAAFAIMNAMVSVSKINDWYFRTDFFNFRVRLRTFIDIFADNVKLVAHHIHENNIAIEKVLADGFATMYAHYLNPETLLRLIDTFSVEGYKVLFRVGLALLTNASQALLQTKNLKEFRETLIVESKKLEPDKLSHLAFGVYLSRDKFDRLDLIYKETLVNVSKTEELQVARRWPSWDVNWTKQSNILKHKSDFLQLWIWLPPQCHIGDFHMLFNTNEDGYKLSTLYDKCVGRENLLILIETTTEESFGFHVSSLYNAPQEEPFVDTQIVTFMLSYPNKKIERQVFEPPQIQFSYLRDQPERTFTMKRMNRREIRDNLSISVPEGSHKHDGNALENALEDAIDKTKEPVKFEEKTKSDGKTKNKLDEVSSSESSPSPDEGMKERKVTFRTRLDIPMTRSQSTPQQQSQPSDSQSTTISNDNKVKEKNVTNKKKSRSGAFLRVSSSISPRRKKKNKSGIYTNADEFMDEELALFQVDETKSKWKKLYTRMLSPSQSVRPPKAIDNNIIRLDSSPSNGDEDNTNNNKEKEEKEELNKDEKEDNITVRRRSSDLLDSPAIEYAHTVIEVQHDYMAIGNGEIHAIYIDSNLNNGRTRECLALRCPRLVQNPDGDFQIRNIEIWCVD